MEARCRKGEQSPLLITIGLQPAWTHDLPVCFPAHPCTDYQPYEADVINFTTSLTPATPGIAAGCFIVLGIALVLIALGVRPHPRRPRPGLGSVALSAAITLLGLLIASIADLRFNAISAIYGLEDSGGPEFDGSWWLLNTAGQAMTAAGLVALVVSATIAVSRLKAAASTASSNRFGPAMARQAAVASKP